MKSNREILTEKIKEVNVMTRKKKRVTWQSKLTKSELKHLKDASVTDKASLERNFIGQAEMRKDRPEWSDPCWECRAIAEKLGFPV